MNHLELPAGNMGGDGGSPMSGAINYPPSNKADLQNPRSNQNGPIAGARLTATDMGDPPTPPNSETNDADSIHRLLLPWRRPPLTANQRLHWTARHRLTAETRQTAAWLAKAVRIPAGAHATVTLTWAPGDRRRRDVDNLVPTLKACCDGLLDAGVVPDDTPEHMTKHMPRLVAGSVDMWLDVIVSGP